MRKGRLTLCATDWLAIFWCIVGCVGLILLSCVSALFRWKDGAESSVLNQSVQCLYPWDRTLDNDSCLYRRRCNFCYFPICWDCKSLHSLTLICRWFPVAVVFAQRAPRPQIAEAKFRLIAHHRSVRHYSCYLLRDYLRYRELKGGSFHRSILS